MAVLNAERYPVVAKSEFKISDGKKKNAKINILTPFRKAVWRVVQGIPEGETRSYAWVARKIGRPRAARAVGQALKKNPYPGIIPCHRVICSDGTLGGFSQGLNMKKKLLERERKKKRC